MPTVQKTFAFAADAEGLTDQAVSGVAFAFLSSDGNPAGCVRFTQGTKSVTHTERAKTAALAWTDYGVPSGATVNTVRVVSYSRKVAAVTKLSSHSHVIRVGGASLATETLPTATGAWLSGGGIAAASAPADPQLEIEYTVTTSGGGGGASVDARFDQIVVEVDYTEGAAPISGSGGVSFGFSTSGSGTVTAPSYTGSGGVAFGFSTSGSGSFVPAPVIGSGGVSFGFTTSGSGTSGSPGVAGSGGVSFGFATSGSGTYTPPAVSGSGGVAFGFTTSGSGSVGTASHTGSGGVVFGFSISGSGVHVPPFGSGPWISHGTVHLGHPPKH